jgi:hypothetical protein
MREALKKLAFGGRCPRQFKKNTAGISRRCFLFGFDFYPRAFWKAIPPKFNFLILLFLGTFTLGGLTFSGFSGKPEISSSLHKTNSTP